MEPVPPGINRVWVYNRGTLLRPLCLSTPTYRLGSRSFPLPDCITIGLTQQGQRHLLVKGVDSLHLRQKGEEGFLLQDGAPREVETCSRG